MWDELGRTGPVFRQPWPEYDPELAQEEEAEMPVQINGKLRGRIRIPFGATRELSEQRALAFSGTQRVEYLRRKLSYAEAIKETLRVLRVGIVVVMPPWSKCSVTRCHDNLQRSHRWFESLRHCR